jgi:two-component system phosphate regulon sensor histidine kinase PhoR
LLAQEQTLSFPHWSRPEDAGEVAGVSAELHSALANLVGNAIRYTPAGGRIEVQWNWQPDGSAEFLVRDTGPGIDAEHLPRITERFYRVDRSRSRDTGGTGLGLAIVKHVAQRHGAQLLIDSVAGKGSTFRLVFPAMRLRRPAQS